MENKWFVAIQAGAISFLDEGIPEVLDIFQEKACVNALFLANQTFSRGTGGRQLEGHPIPDHGGQEYDQDYVGGNFGKTHHEFYPNTFIQEFEAPESDTGGIDILEAVIPEAKKRGIQVYCWCEMAGPPARAVPGFARCLEIDQWGRTRPNGCYNNPDYRNWHLGMMEDFARSYDIDGICWCSERQSPLADHFIWFHWNGGCFCEHCLRTGARRGINTQKAIEGYRKLGEFVKDCRADRRPTDGYFIRFWRILMEFPEILAWEKLWIDGQHGLMAEIYGTVKAVAPKVQIGWHIMHFLTLSPFYRAEQDFSVLKEFSDFIKVVAYHNCAGPRFKFSADCLHATLLKDAEPQDGYRLLQKIFNLDEAPYEEAAKTPFSAEYVRRETERAKKGVADGCLIYPGIDIDIPTGPEQAQSTREGVRDAVKAAHAGGAEGVVLSRKYSEMMLDNLAGAGDAIRELGLD